MLEIGLPQTPSLRVDSDVTNLVLSTVLPCPNDVVDLDELTHHRVKNLPILILSDTVPNDIVVDEVQLEIGCATSANPHDGYSLGDRGSRG
jgi:hypothetical protein